MSDPKTTRTQESASSEPLGKTMSFVDGLAEESRTMYQKGFHASYPTSEAVPRSSLNYPEGRSTSNPLGEASAWSGHVTRILPPKEDFRKLLDNPSLISEEAKEIERELAKEFGLD